MERSQRLRAPSHRVLRAKIRLLVASRKHDPVVLVVLRSSTHEGLGTERRPKAICDEELDARSCWRAGHKTQLHVPLLAVSILPGRQQSDLALCNICKIRPSFVLRDAIQCAPDFPRPFASGSSLRPHNSPVLRTVASLTLGLRVPIKKTSHDAQTRSTLADDSRVHILKEEGPGSFLPDIAIEKLANPHSADRSRFQRHRVLQFLAQRWNCELDRAIQEPGPPRSRDVA
mmetsp:Transcript_44235/g.88774  ORF Transcript_44235/g.88774 Transcript_44235/m.88774 type:complete len:230 (+) Transcript_44235:93-782(+)